MSEWYTAETDDIAIDRESSEVNILVTNNDWGNIYLCLTFDMIKAITSKIEEHSLDAKT